MRYFSSDLHLGHRNIVDYARRPIPGTDAMAEHLADGYRQVGTFSIAPEAR
jgi:calcineurin-like phosphoesterase family protein